MKKLFYLFYIFINLNLFSQDKLFVVEKGSIEYDKFLSMLMPEAAFVELNTNISDLKIESNTKGIIKELPNPFSKNRIFAIYSEKQKFQISKKGFKEVKILIPKLYPSQKISFLIK